MTDYVGVNEQGRRVGESHWNAKLTDLQVEMIRQLREDYKVPYSIICGVLALPKSTVEGICCYQTRGQMPVKVVPKSNPRNRKKKSKASHEN